MEIITGKIIRKIFYAPNDGYVVFKMSPTNYSESITCVGYLPPYFSDDGEVEGYEVEVAGKWKTSKYGRQFNFEKIKVSGDNEYNFFIKLVKGIGPSLAQTIQKNLSSQELIYFLEKNPEKLLEIPGIGPKKLKEIKASWEKAKSFRNLYAFFEEKGAIKNITSEMLIKIYNHFTRKKEDPKQVIIANPYRLTEIRGIGFKTADKIALSLGISPDDERRFIAGLKYILKKKSEEEGHTVFTLASCKTAIKAELYSSEEVFVPGNIIDKKIEKIFKSPPDFVFVENELIGLKLYRFMEEYILNKLHSLSVDNNILDVSKEKIDSLLKDFEKREGFLLEKEQKEFVIKALTTQRVLGLVGYAGTGKTTVLKALLYCLREGNLLEDYEIACCAFTGMAARRLREVTGFQNCYTIHSLLMWIQGEFQFNAQNPLPHKFIILDEASMVNLPLFFHLVSALNDHACFIIVGDPAQLPPIGAGNVFCDLVQKEYIPLVKLRKIKRQSEDSAITVIANKIRRGIFPEDYIKVNWKDFAWVPVKLPNNIWLAKKEGNNSKTIANLRAENNEKIRDYILDIVISYIHKGKNLNEIQVLSPMKIGPLGTQALNKELQNLFNPPEEGKKEINKRGIIFRQKDKVINLENRDVKLLEGGFVRILNGQIGFILDFNIKLNQVLIKFLDIEDYIVVLNLDDLGKKIDLAYCLTVHKSQGSQYPIVLIPMTSSHWYMLNSQWLYTALTRAYDFCWLIGEKSALKRASTNTETIKRQTWLSLEAPLGVQWK